MKGKFRGNFTEIYSVFGSVTSRCDQVTLTFDPVTLHVCYRSGVTWSNYLPRL